MSHVTLTYPEKHIALITLNQPDSLNAMSEAMAQEFKKIVQEISSKEASLRGVILSGAGRAFSAGGDLEMLQKKIGVPQDENKKIMLSFYDSFLGIHRLSIPSVAAINGPAIGAGLCVACGCDIRIASANATFGFTFTRLGLHPGMGATFFVPQVIGEGHARELLLTGRIIKADEALRIGLVGRLVDEGSVITEAQKTIEEIAACGPLATRQLLESLKLRPRTLAEALDREASCQSINYETSEYAEGLMAVREKRKARFQ